MKLISVLLALCLTFILGEVLGEMIAYDRLYNQLFLIRVELEGVNKQLREQSKNLKFVEEGNRRVLATVQGVAVEVDSLRLALLPPRVRSEPAEAEFPDEQIASSPSLR